MSLTIDLTPELEIRLRTEAEKRGLMADDYARLLLERILTPSDAEAEEAARLTAIDAAMGAFADVPFSSDDFAREKQDEIDREEARYQERFA